MNYKEFGNQPGMTLEEYKDFYFNRFPELLKWYYPSLSDDGSMILFATRKPNGERRFRAPSMLLSDNENGIDKLDSTGQYFFAASVYFMNLIPQVFIRILGYSKCLFNKASGWPLMSCGLGGIMSPETWLQDSELYPERREAPFFNVLLDIILPFHQEEVRTFLSGGQPSVDSVAYRSLCRLACNKVELITEEIARYVKLSQEAFLKGDCNSYLTQEELARCLN